ncbi:unnamed protein product [Enterobius vermicularis]|uniref:C3H1-type domain-containing protein n=1 Tax=Enterobius vermicularis TaxID=51028 RepID=A0A0N4VG65_ENTVE|nr:unnamed protein product [Enterobius vermicularis]
MKRTKMAVFSEFRKANAYKTALCQAFKESGFCSYGPACRFAHGEQELRLPPQTHPKYKTQLCNKFALFGRCPYGPRCQFIHQRPNHSNHFFQNLDDVGRSQNSGKAGHPLQISSGEGTSIKKLVLYRSTLFMWC